MIGEMVLSTKGTPMRIIAERSRNDIDVEFLDDYHYVKEHTTYTNFKRGQIKNPFDPTNSGAGFIGDGIYKTEIDDKTTDVFVVWRAMIEREYGKVEKFPSYIGITKIYRDWLNFQNFAKWFEENKYECEGRLHLDKDIKYPGNKIYSPYHCLLVPQRINMLFTNKSNNRGLPNGIYKTKSGKYNAKYNSKELGSYQTIEEAYSVYAKAKKEAIIQIAEEYKDKVPIEVYKALLNYEVRIENDKNWVAA